MIVVAGAMTVLAIHRHVFSMVQADVNFTRGDVLVLTNRQGT
jgi:hypothetical protein